MIFNRLLLIIIVFLSLSSCCTKKDCDQDNFPKIVVGYSGIDGDEPNSKMIYVLDKVTHNKIDSMDLSNPNHYIVIDKWLMYDIFGDKREFKQYDFLLKLPNRKDSVTNIKYDRTSEKIECNSCFPFGDGSATVTDFENLGFNINNESYATSDTVVIDAK